MELIKPVTIFRARNSCYTFLLSVMRFNFLQARGSHRYELISRSWQIVIALTVSHRISEVQSRTMPLMHVTGSLEIDNCVNIDCETTVRKLHIVELELVPYEYWNGIYLFHVCENIISQILICFSCVLFWVSKHMSQWEPTKIRNDYNMAKKNPSISTMREANWRSLKSWKLCE